MKKTRGTLKIRITKRETKNLFIGVANCMRYPPKCFSKRSACKDVYECHAHSFQRNYIKVLPLKRAGFVKDKDRARILQTSAITALYF